MTAGLVLLAPTIGHRNTDGTWDIQEPAIHAEYGARYLCTLLADVRAPASSPASSCT